MDSLCIRCKGKGLCNKPCKILANLRRNSPKPKLHFSGKSSPELFVGRAGYPNVNSGILVPSENDNISNFPSAEEWEKNNFSVANILRLRGQLIYGKSQMNIKLPSKLKQVTQDLALSSKPVSTEIFLKKKPTFQFSLDKVFQPMTNPAPISRAILEENLHVPKKVDYLVNDNNVGSMDAIKELYNSNIKINHLQKLLSIGLLGKKINRKMVPTRWSITAVDDNISKQYLEKIRYFPQVNRISLYSGNFLGNYMEILLLPGNFSFEVIEAWVPEILSSEKIEFFSDFESFNGRKKYAFNVCGGYYAIRLPLTEYLFNIKRQATTLVFREILPEYYAPLGVGIVREASRRAFQNRPKYFDSISDALKYLDERRQTSMEVVRKRSWILDNYGKQKSIFDLYS